MHRIQISALFVLIAAILIGMRWFIAFPSGFCLGMLLPAGTLITTIQYTPPMPRTGLARAGDEHMST